MASSISSISTRFCFVANNNSGCQKPKPCVYQSSLSSNSLIKHRRQLSSSQIPVVETDDDDKEGLTFSGCGGCGKEVKENGCNGDGRIQGGIATVPGFGWWPIKAYRPCPGFVEAGGRYRRIGQSMDEVAFGRPDSNSSTDS